MEGEEMIKLKSKSESLIKKGIICIGDDSEGNPILIEAKTRGLINKELIECETEIYKKYKVPIRQKDFRELTDQEKKMYKLGSEAEMIERGFIINMIDEDNPKVASIKNDINTRLLTANLASYFNMEAQVEAVDGTIVDNWGRWGITSKKLVDLVEFLLDDINGMGIGNLELSNIKEEIISIKTSQVTEGQQKLEQLQALEELEKVNENL